MAQSLPRNMKVRGVRSDKELGATCISFNQEDKETFVVGSESGCVFKCSLHAKGNPAGSKAVNYNIVKQAQTPAMLMLIC